ncbi:hypothetical protein V9L16_16510 [Pseudomonas tolaasii]|uniref:hypothetical protein n=1 Tax=Pseudomonas tolaasii TaxID=29442 RepID=UPI0030CAFF7D
MINIRLFSINTPAFQSNQPIPQKNHAVSQQAAADHPLLSVANVRSTPTLSRSRRDLQNDPAQGAPLKESVRQFAKALIEQGDRQLAISVGNALVRRQSLLDERVLNEIDNVPVPPYSTFGQALSRLADAVEAEPFKSFAQTYSLDVSELYFREDGVLQAANKVSKGHYLQFEHDDEVWAAASAEVLAAAKQLMGRNQTVVGFSGRDHAYRNDVSDFYGFSEPATTDSNALLSAAGQLLRDENFKSLSSSNPLDAPIKQKQADARQHIADLPLPALREILNKFAPLTAPQKVQRADQELAQLAARGMMKLIPETDQYDPSPTLQDIPEYSTFNRVRKNLLKALTGSVFTAFAKENELDPTSVRINPVSGELMGTVKGVNTPFNLNDLSGWSDTWAEIKDAVLQMAAGSEDDVTYPTDNTAPLSQVMTFYNEPYPHQEDARKKGWEQRQLANTLRRIAEMTGNDGFKALTAPLPSDPPAVAVQQRQRDRVRQLEGTTLSPSPMETLTATVKANLPVHAASEDSTEDLWAIAESDLAKTVHKAMLELKTNPAQFASKIIQPIPGNSLLGQWQAYLDKALKGRGFNEWAREQNIDLTSLRYDPADNALIAKVKGADKRFTATDFAQKYPTHFDVLTPVLSAAQAFAKPGRSISLSHAETSGVPYQWVAHFYHLNADPNSSAFDQQTALIGRTPRFPAAPANPKKIVTWLNRQKTALGDSNDRYALIHELKNWTADTGLKPFVVDPDSSHQPKSVTTVTAFILNNGWYPIPSKAGSDNLLAALQTQVPTAPPLGNRWGFLSTQLPLSNAQRDALVKEVKNKIGTDETLLNYLSSKIANLDAKPQQALEQLLSSDDALELADFLQTRMKGAITPTSLKQWLLTALVLELDPTAGTQHKTVAGADLTDPDYVGRSTRFIRDRFNQYLTANKNIPSNLAPVVSHLLLSGAAPQLLVKDVPKKVTLGSLEWFNFTAAVNQIEWTAPGAAANMTYEQVMSHYNIQPVSALEAQIKSYAQMNPLLDWAALNNKVDKNNYTLDQLKDSQQKLQAQANRTAEAVRWLSTNNPPNRRDMALKVLREKCGTDNDYETGFMQENHFAGVISDGHYSLVEIYETGRLDESWIQMGKHVDFDSIREKAKEPGFTVINDEFDKAIKADFDLRRRHTATLFENMLKKLPLDEYKSLLYGNVEFLNVEGAGSGMVITSIYNGVRRDFAVYPAWGQIIRIPDIDPETPLGQKVSLEIDAEAFKNGTEPRSGVKSEVVLRSTDQHLLDDNNEPWPLEISFPAHKENDPVSPNYVTGRVSKLAKVMIDSTYLYKAEFFNLHRNKFTNTLEKVTEPRDVFRALWHSLPGASSLEDLYYGQYSKAFLDLAIDAAIIVGTEGAGMLWGLAKTAASWGAAKVAAGFIEKFGVKGAENVALIDMSTAATSEAIKGVSRLQSSPLVQQATENGIQDAVIADRKVLRADTAERIKASTILENGQRYSYNALKMQAEGPALEGVIAEGRERIGHIRLGGPLENVKALDGEIQTFVDTYDGKPRLNIMGHGPQPEKPGDAIKIIGDNDALYSAAEVDQKLLARGVNIRDYPNVRTLTCYSASGGEASYAAQLQKITGVPVKGFESTVTTDWLEGTELSMEYQRLLRETRRKFPKFSQADVEEWAEIQLNKLVKNKLDVLEVRKDVGTTIDVNIGTTAQPVYITMPVEYAPVHFGPPKIK